MTKTQKKKLIRIIVAAALGAAALFASFEGWAKLAVYLLPYIIVGYPTLLKAGRNIINGQIFDENFLMSIATVCAFIIGEYPEAVAVMLFYQIGELFENIAVGKSRKSISQLVDLQPEYANLERDGEIVEADPFEVEVGDVIIVKPGEKIPLDGVVTEGQSALNTSALTGESNPRDVFVGDTVVSGCINIHGLLKVRVTKNYENSTVAKILEIIEQSPSNKASSESFITRFAKYYTPAVVGAALVVAIVPPLFGEPFDEWIYRAMTFLVVSCPCAFVISVPLTFFAGIGGASKRGILVKGSNFLENLANVKMAVFDKTGTLTKGVFKVSEIRPEQISKEELLETAAHVEYFSEHPISRSLVEAYGGAIDATRVSALEQVAGKGVFARLDGRTVYVGNVELMKRADVDVYDVSSAGTVVHVADDRGYLGYIVIADCLKDNAAQAVARLKSVGKMKTVMLTGDREEVARELASQANIDQYHAALLPTDKVDHLFRLKNTLSPKAKLMYVGDGINDVPSIANADIGVAMGGLGSDVAIEAADVVIMDDDLSKLADAYEISAKTTRIVWQNIVFAFVVKLAVIILGLFGVSTMWEAVFADVGVTVIAVLNAMRALKK